MKLLKLFIIYLVFFFSNFALSYELHDKRNKAIVDKIFEEDQFIVIEDYNYIPYGNIISIDNRILKSSFYFVIKLTEEGEAYRELFDFYDIDKVKSLNLTSLWIELSWIDPRTSYFMD